MKYMESRALYASMLLNVIQIFKIYKPNHFTAFQNYIHGIQPMY